MTTNKNTPVKQTTMPVNSETIQTIFQRRAVRKYSDKEVDRTTIEKIIDAGRMAPSAMNTQPWKFYVLTKKADIEFYSKEIRHSITHALPHIGLKSIFKAGLEGLKHLSFGIEFLKEKDPVFHGAPVVIFITAPKDYEWAGLDIGMCSQNMMLSAKALGLDTCPVGFGKFVMYSKSFNQLGIPEKEEILLAIIIGYGNEEPEIHPRKKDNVIYL